MTAAVQTRPGAEQHVYVPRGTAKAVFACRDAEVLLSGPAGTGKSRAILEKLNLMCLLNPGMRALMVRKTLTSLSSTALVTWREHVVAEALAAGQVRFHGGSSQQAAQYVYKNGSTVTIGGMDKATKVMSSEYDFIYVQEGIELTEEDWEALTTRLRNGKVSFQQLAADANPDKPTHWLKMRCDRGQTTMLNTRHEDNPILFDDEGQVTDVGASYISKLDALTGVRRDRLRFGKWCAAEGLIYEDFDPNVHRYQISEPPDDWVRYWTVDFGFTNPFVCQFWAVDPDGRLYLYRELYRARRLVEDHARDILKIVTRKDGSWKEPKPRAVICDHDAEDRATLERHLGLSTVAATKTVSDGIQAVQERLKIQPDGRPRLFISPTALVNVDAKGIPRVGLADESLKDAGKPTCTLEEIPGYVWDTSTATGRDKNLREFPKKLDDHGCLVAGTLVATERGAVPIERVSAGDRVFTREGLCEVTEAGMTSAAAKVFRVELSNGYHLVGTGNHPVWTQDRDFIRIDALRYGDRLVSWSTWSESGSTASSSGAIRTRKSGRSATTSSPATPTVSTASDGSMKRSGRLFTVLSRLAARFTTQTSIRSTTTPATSSASPSPSTKTLTASAAGNVAVHPQLRPTSSESGLSPWRGTGPTLAANGTGTTLPSRVSATPSLTQVSVSSVAPTLPRQPSMAGSGSARTTVSRPGGAPPDSMTSTSSALSAATPSAPTATRGPSAADVRVLNVVELDTPRPVYNLTVPGKPEYFANGVLVHNCDAARYAVAELDFAPRPRVRWLA